MDNVTVDFDATKVKTRLTRSNILAQKWLDNEVLKDSAPFVPRLTGSLEGTGISGTVIGKGEIDYNSPYARAQYYGDFEHSKQAHPLACKLWFEAAKAINKSKWIRGVKALGGGG